MFVIHFLTVMCQARIYDICVFLQKVSWPIYFFPANGLLLTIIEQ